MSGAQVVTEPISFTGRLCLEDVLDIHRYRSRVILRPAIWWLMAIVSLAIAALVLTVSLKTHFSGFSIVVLGFCIFLPFGAGFVDRLIVRWYYHRHRDKYTDTTVTIASDSIYTAAPSADIRMNWQVLECIIATPRGLLFLTPPRQVWFWLPERVFRDNDHRDTILALAAEHHVLIRRMT